MKNKILTTVFSLAMLAFLHSCKDIVSPNLRNKSLTILAPTNNFVSKNFSILFWWETIEDADQYNIQIIKPSFTAGQQLIVDTLVSGNKYSQTLEPGNYQWRVRGQNSTSYTDYVTYNLTIDSSLNLSSQKIVLISPNDNVFSNKLTQSFSWFAMPNTTNYIFSISQGGTQIGNLETIKTTSTTYTFTTEGTYKWRVFAQNDQSVSIYAERTITIDTTKPGIPIITFNPSNDTTSLKPVPLSWSSNNNGLFTIQISKDSFLIPGNILVDTSTPELKYDFSPLPLIKTYYWRVSATDSSTNVSAYSPIHRFKVP